MTAVLILNDEEGYFSPSRPVQGSWQSVRQGLPGAWTVGNTDRAQVRFDNPDCLVGLICTIRQGMTFDWTSWSSPVFSGPFGTLELTAVRDVILYQQVKICE